MNSELEQQKDIDLYLDSLIYEIGDVRKFNIKNPFLTKEWDDKKNLPELLIETFRSPENLHSFCKLVLKIDLLPYQCVVLQMLWCKRFPLIIMTRGGGKTYLLSLYILIRAILQQGIKIVVVGAALRQSMLLFNYCETFWNNSSMVRDICGNRSDQGPKRDIHMCYMRVGQSEIKFLPLGTGEKIRGQRAQIIVGDEFDSISPPIFETVIRGFAAVKSQNLFENVSNMYKKRKLEELGVLVSDLEKIDSDIGTSVSLPGNQIILSGSAGYQFGHFYKYYKYYKAIILSGGDQRAISYEFPDMNISPDLDPNDYCIIRIPYEFLPEGMMDSHIINQAKATMDKTIFNMEYGAVFMADSEGFYLASWIHACTCRQDGIDTPFGKINFNPQLSGIPGKVYVMGIDPASEQDNFSINIMLCENKYGCIVYQWSTNRREFEKLKSQGLVVDDIQDYNTFCIRHIRDLVRRFHISLIVMDSGGGGISLREGLRDPSKCLDGDNLIFDMDDENTTGLTGDKILKMIEFTKYEWRKEAYWGLRKDIIDRVIFFPRYDEAGIEIQNFYDAKIGKKLDTLEECCIQIEQCKVEMTYIQHGKTQTGLEKWEVPSIIGVDADSNKKKLKKDRFTSLLLSNWGRRILQGLFTEPYVPIGGVAKNIQPIQAGGSAYYGDGANQMQNAQDCLVRPCIISESDNSKRKIFY